MIKVARPKMSVSLTKVPISIAILKDAKGIIIMLKAKLIKKREDNLNFLEKGSVKTQPGNKKT